MIDYVGENLIAGQVGELLIALSFVSSILAMIFYFKSSELSLEVNSWKRLGRMFYRIHSVALLGIIGILFYLIYTHSFEYYYVWRHSSTTLPVRYILSCFWEGQEGSTMLWAFWNIVLGNILIKTAKKWEGGVMTIFSSVQAFHLAMLLGIFVFDIQIGSNPFILLREHTDMLSLPFTSNPNYLEFVEGNGLNPLLQNYWMVIHPPTVFFGFASTLVPFAFAITALWKREFHSWIQAALPWAFFGVGILGLGVLMGGAWAYEALSFGGFWAWDPVENSSLVPWIILVAAGHLMLINRNKMRSMFATFTLTLLAFILVIYSTYLTKSGILGETSVHSFADGLPGQLIIFLVFYILLAFFFLFKNGWGLINKNEEDAFWSREFWIFIATLVLVISAFQITLSTSIPVINAIFGTDMAPPADPISHYNSWQIPLTILITFLIGFTQWLKYKKTAVKPLLKIITPSIIAAIIAAFGMAYVLEIRKPFLNLLLFSSFFAIFSNVDYFIRMFRGSVKKGGSTIAHIGFGMLVLGSLLSAGNTDIISKNTTPVNIKFDNDKDANDENIMMIKGDTVLMEPYFVTYLDRRIEDKFVYYDMDYLKLDAEGRYVKQFTLSPFVQLNEQMGNVPEPSTKHYWNRDIFTHITYADLDNLDENSQEEYRDADTLEIAIGDSIFISNSVIIIESLERNVDSSVHEMLTKNRIGLGLKIKARTLTGNTYEVMPLMIVDVENNRVFNPWVEIEELGVRFSYATTTKMDYDKVELRIAEKNKNSADFVIMQALVFPYINVLWIGCIVMVLGSFISAYNRVQERRKKNKQLNK